MEWLHNIGSLVCHQLPERSLQMDGTAFPLCYRCTGFYLAVIFSYLLLSLPRVRRQLLMHDRSALLYVAFLLPLLADGAGGNLGLWSSGGITRACTGVMAGVVFPWLLALLRTRDCAAQAHLSALIYFALPMAAAALGVLLLSAKPSHEIFTAAAVLCTAGVLLLIGHLLLSMPFFDAPAARPKPKRQEI